MRRRGTVFIFATVFAAFSFAVQQGRGQQPNLNGLWKNSDGELVRLIHEGQSLRADLPGRRFCPYGGERTTYLTGRLQGSALTGNLITCTRSEKLVRDCGVESVWTTSFKATVNDENNISGTFQGEYWMGDEEDGRMVNCYIDHHYTRDVSLTRVTDCEAAIAEARQRMNDADRRRKSHEQIQQTYEEAFEATQQQFWDVTAEVWLGETINQVVGNLGPPAEAAKLGYDVSGADAWPEWLGAGRDAAKLLADVFSELRWGQVAGDAFKKTSWAGPVKSLAEYGAKMLVLNEQMNNDLSRVITEGQRATEAFAEYVDSRQDLMLLEEECNGEPPREEEQKERTDPDDAEQKAAREAYEEATQLYEQARALMDSWKRVGNLYEDAEGNFIPADMAFDRALDVVASGQTADAFTEEEWEVFQSSMTEGLEHLAASFGVLLKTAPELARIERLEAAVRNE